MRHRAADRVRTPATASGARHELDPTSDTGRLLLSMAALTTMALVVALPVLERFKIEGDIKDHASYAPEIATSAGAISYSLWYPLLFWSTGGSYDQTTLQDASALLLTLAVLAKVWVAAWFAWRGTRRSTVALVAGTVALLAMPLPNPAQPERIYLGQISQTVWHNSTWIFSIPFSIVAFWLACRYLRSLDARSARLLSLALVVSTACKPNFSLALLPCLGIAALVLHLRRGDRPLLVLTRVLTVFAPVTVLLLLQFVLTFGSDAIIDVSLGVAPLAVWKVFSANVPWSIAVSFVGPVAMLVALRASGRRSVEIRLAVATLVLAVAQLAILTERKPDGQIAVFGNFFWGAYTATAVVFLVLITALGASFPWHGVAEKLKVGIAAVVVAAHCLTGVYYVTHAGVDGFPITFRDGTNLQLR